MKYEDIKTGGVYRNHKIRTKNNVAHQCIVLRKNKPDIYDSLILSTWQKGAKFLPGLSSKIGKDIYLSLPYLDKPKDLSLSNYQISDERDFRVINSMRKKIK